MSTVAVENTLPEKLLLAASHLEEAGQSPFSAEALIVSAWQKFPRTFGLKYSPVDLGTDRGTFTLTYQQNGGTSVQQVVTSPGGRIGRHRADDR